MQQRVPSTKGPATSAAAPNEGENNPKARVVLDELAVARAVKRMAHEILERNHTSNDLVLIGLVKGGAWLAQALSSTLGSLGEPAPAGTLDVSFYRDDLELRTITPEISNLEFGIDDKTVVLVDDVLYTGRTVRAALDALRAYGRPKQVQLAVMVDRGHRELPIRADFVGKNLPTSRAEKVVATEAGVVIE